VSQVLRRLVDGYEPDYIGGWTFCAL